MTRYFEVGGHQALGFDTGLDARAFAQAKLAQFITEPGLIVHRGGADNTRGSVEWWKASGVVEAAGSGGTPSMIVWGPSFHGERLDTLLGNATRGNALAAISAWMQAILVVGENALTVPLWPSAAIIADSGVFYAPPALAQRCMTALDQGAWYVHPDLSGMEAAAFTAAAMLYQVFSGTPPFTAHNESLLHQDIREGNFLPVRFAVPGLNERLAALIQSALDHTSRGSAILGEALAILQAGDLNALVQPLPEPDQLLLEKEKTRYIKIKTTSVQARRFIARNMVVLFLCGAAAVGMAIIIGSVAHSRAQLPTTAGMTATQVIQHYYMAMGSLDHQMMEACVTGGAGKDDISTVINFFVLSKTRQSYEIGAPPMVISAYQWQQNGKGDTDAPLFGAADLDILRLEGDETLDTVRYQVDYIFWVPAQVSDDLEMGGDENSLSRFQRRSDYITLALKKGNWRITDIQRTFR